MKSLGAFFFLLGLALIGVAFLAGSSNTLWPGGFLIAAGILIILGMVMAALGGSLDRGESGPTSPATRTVEEMTKKCPQCAESIKLEALVCRYCGNRFDPEEVRKDVRRVEEKTHEVAEGSAPAARLSPWEEAREKLAAGVPLEAHTSATAGGVAAEVSRTLGSPAIWYVVFDYVTEQQRKMLFTITAQMNLGETEIEPFGEKGIKIGRPLAIDDANALMSRFLGAGIVSKKMSSTANPPGDEPRMQVRATGVDGELQLFETMVRIKRNRWGVLAGKGDKDIQIAQISSIQLRRPGVLTDGYIQLSIARGVEQQQSDAQEYPPQGMGENSVSFNERQASAFHRIKDVIESRMASGEATTDNR